MSREVDFIDLYEYMLAQDVTEPVVVSKNGRKHAVLIPYELYAAHQKANRQVLTPGTISDDDLKAIMDSEIPADLHEYDDEVEK